MKQPEVIKPKAAGEVDAPDVTRSKLIGKRFVFTSAQNNTYVHKGFLKALELFCATNDADLVVSRFAYNKSGFQNKTKGDKALWYDPSIKDYIVDESCEITPELLFCGELDILPTAVNPLSGLANYCRQASGIVPHVKVAMQSLPGIKADGARFLYSTGAITLRNYIQKKSGQKAEFHHTYGALYVEIDEQGRFFCRQLIAETSGSFYDLTTKYQANGKCKHNQYIEALNPGDIHVEKSCTIINDATFFSTTSIASFLRPKYIFVHDLSDFTVRNHHGIKDPHFLAKQEFSSRHTVESGLHEASVFLSELEDVCEQVVVVESNHDQALDLWLRTADIKADPKNARFFHECNSKVYKHIELRLPFNIFNNIVSNGVALHRTTFLGEDDSFIICKDVDGSGGIECALHGHRGANGSRGTPRGLQSLGRKINSGHTHSAGILSGVYTAGVSAKLEMGYNKGPSSWSHSHIITYPNGKRAIITIKDGRWRA